MIQGSMSLGTAGIVSIVSMVFVVLLVLFLAVLIFGKIASSRKAKAQPAAAKAAPAAASAAPAQDDRDLLCVLAAAVAAYEEGSGNPMVRNRGDLD